MRLHNFSAGPGALPLSVLETVKRDLLNYKNTGVSVMELSHRSPEIIDLIDDTVEGFRQILELDREWELLLLQGGGSLQFLMVPLNLSKQGDRIDYIDTGYWSEKAINEAQNSQRDVAVIASGKASLYCSLPSIDHIFTRDRARYLHICSNNTVAGTQWHQLPDQGAPLVIDASSDFLSRKLLLNNINCIYAHAQKNVGVAGLTVVAVRKSAIQNNSLPAILDYRMHITAKSNYHTPPVFAIYVTNLIQKWLIHEIGGLEAMIERNILKANILYQFIEESKYFNCPIKSEDRSMMNVVFTMGNEFNDKEFIAYCERNNIIGLAGHRSRGQLRASLYNAVSLEDVKALITAMHSFGKSL
jgi:phosphoserine aminotransferase